MGSTCASSASTVSKADGDDAVISCSTMSGTEKCGDMLNRVLLISSSVTSCVDVDGAGLLSSTASGADNDHD
jgi:hypothetical protein